MRRAVVLLNLGGPLQKEDIRPFLFNFFTDKNIIGLPVFLRYPLAALISRKRSKGAALDAYKELGFKSPLLENTKAQAQALQDVLGEDYKVFVSMRYWHPLADAVAADVKAYDPDEVVLLPLYPQFSTTTTGSSFEDWDRAAQKAGLDKPCRRIGCYPEEEGFITASAENIIKVLKDALDNTRILFSAHGLPEKVIEGGDPYQAQCEKTAALIAAKLGIADDAWQICYQSRVGPLKWIGPSTEEALQKAADDKVGVILYPHAFVSEHVETLVEIDMEYRHMAKDMGVPWFGKAETVGTHPEFIQALAKLVQAEKVIKLPGKCSASSTKCICKRAA